jgi:hypothetical protein
MDRRSLLMMSFITAQEVAKDKYPPMDEKVDLDALLSEDIDDLSGHRATPPKNVPPEPRAAVDMLRRHFKDDVTLVSRVLNHDFPNDFLFYRVCDYERGLFDALEFLGDEVEEFRFDFDRIGRKGLDRYLRFNEVIQGSVRLWWSRLADYNPLVTAWLFDALAGLFTTRSEYFRYWVFATQPEYFESRDAGEDVAWSGRVEMGPDDLVFFYRTSPRSAITDIYRVTQDPRFDPWGGWRGFWLDLEKVTAIPGIKFQTLRADPLLAAWPPVARSFQGVIAEPISHRVYNRLLDEIPAAIRDAHNLAPERFGPEGTSGDFVDELDFEDRVIDPLLRGWGVRFKRLYPCRFAFGSQTHDGRVDFYVSDDKGPVTLFENKFRILDDRHRDAARDQAKSYALMLGLPSFVVAAPEGVWVYSLDRHRPTLELRVSGQDLERQGDTIRSKVLSLRD